VQLLALGFSKSAIGRALRGGRLHVVYPGVYAVGHRALSVRGQVIAALLYAREGACLSHVSAGWWWGIVDGEGRRPSIGGPGAHSGDGPPQIIEISARGYHSSLPNLRVYRPRRIEATRHRGLPVTTPARTLREIAGLIEFRDLRRALAEAEFRRLVTLDELRGSLGQGQRGSTALRRALDQHLPQFARTLSELEDRFLELCEAYGIEIPEVNARVCGFKVDALWRQRHVIVELDGQIAHGTPPAIERDRARDLRLRAAGYIVRRYTWHQITTQPDLVATDLEATLADGARR
jgi:hypothetical protein